MYGYDDIDDRRRFNPESREWREAVAGVEEMLARADLMEAASQADSAAPPADAGE